MFTTIAQSLTVEICILLNKLQDDTDKKANGVSERKGLLMDFSLLRFIKAYIQSCEGITNRGLNIMKSILGKTVFNWP